MNMTMKEFLNNTSLDTSLVKATIKRLGGWETAQLSLKDVSKHGATAGFAGFTYTKDCISFYKRHRLAIVDMLETYVEDFDYQDDIISVVRHFNIFKESRPTTNEVGRTLYGNHIEDRVAEALAWYALERVADDYIFGWEK